jgi:hypothetical protein
MALVVHQHHQEPLQQMDRVVHLLLVVLVDKMQQQERLVPLVHQLLQELQLHLVRLDLVVRQVSQVVKFIT